MCKEQSILIEEPKDWTECLASRKRDSWVKGTESIYWVPSRRQNQLKLVDESFSPETIEQVKQTEKDLDLIETVFSFLGGWN